MNRPVKPPLAGPLLAAVALAFLLGVALLLAEASDTRVHLAEVHLVVTGLLGLWWAFGPGERRGPARTAPAVLGVGALATAGWMLSTGWFYSRPARSTTRRCSSSGPPRG